MELLYSLLLGLVQGLTEFLPVSSSGHLLLVGRIVGFTPSVAFEIVAHLGTLLAVLIVYRSAIKERVLAPFSRKTLVLIFATAVTGVLVLLFEKPLRATFGGELLPYAFALSAILIVVSSFVPEKVGGKIGFFEGFVIGVCQAAAVVPGLSRSGTTISAARMCRADYKQSADFSFLLSVPIIIVSALSELVRHFDEFAGENPLNLLAAFVASAVSGYFAVKLVLRSVRGGKGFKYFAVYLMLLAVFLFINDSFLHFI